MYLTPPLKGLPLKLGIGASGRKSSNDGTWFPGGHGEWKDWRALETEAECVCVYQAQVQLLNNAIAALKEL